MTRPPTLPSLALALVFAALLAGCGSSSTSSPSTAANTAASTSSTSAPSSGSAVSSTSASKSSSSEHLTLSETEFKIIPASAALAHAGPVTITVRNTGKITHVLALQTPAGVLHTPAIAPGASATLKVDLAASGSYTFYCPIAGHRQAGMQGTLVVGHAASGAAGASTSTTASPQSPGASGPAPGAGSGTGSGKGSGSTNYSGGAGY